jgi:Large polyvalent protein associated domain 38
MATYQIKAPDGHTYRINGPDNATQDQVIAAVLQQFPDAGGAKKEPEGFLSELGHSLQRGVGNVISGLAKPLEELPRIADTMNPVASLIRSVLPGQDEVNRKAAETWKQAVAPATSALRGTGSDITTSAGPRETPGLAEAWDKQGVLGALKSGALTVAEGAVPTIAGLGVGALTRNPAAAMAVMAGMGAPQTYTGIRERQAHEGADNIGMALVGTTASTALDILTGAEGAIAKGVGREAALEVLDTGIREAAKRVAKTGAYEAGTEMLQNVIEQVAGDSDPTTKQSMLETMEAGVAGMLGGTFFGGVSEGASRVLPKGAREEAPAPEGEPVPETPEVPEVTPVSRQEVYDRFVQAAGPDLTPDTHADLKALSLRVSNDLSFGGPEDIAKSRKYIRDVSDNLAAGKYPEERIEPLTNALTEAQTMIEQHEAGAKAATEPAPAVEPTPAPAVEPTPAPAVEPTPAPVVEPTPAPVVEPAPRAPREQELLDKAEQVQVLNEKHGDQPLTVTKGTKLIRNGIDGTQHEVELSDGTVVHMYRDTDQFGAHNPIWYVDDPLSSDKSGWEGHDPGLGSTKKEALDRVAERVARGRRETLTQAEQLKVTPNEPIVPPVVGEAPAMQEPAPMEAPTVQEPAPVEAPAVQEPAPAEAPPSEPPAPPATETEVGEEGTPPPKFEPAPNWLVRFADMFRNAKSLNTFAKKAYGYDVLPEQLDIEKKLELYRSSKAGRERDLEREHFNPIVKTVADSGLDIGDVDTYLLARAAPGKNALVAERNSKYPQGGGVFTDAEAAAVIKKFADEGLLPKLEQVGKRVDKLVDRHLADMVEAGVLSEADAKGLRAQQPHYVPMKGFSADGDFTQAYEDEDPHSPSNRQEAEQALRSLAPNRTVNEFRKAFGRESMPFSPLFTLFHDVERTVKRNLINDAYSPLVEMWKKDPAPLEGLFDIYTDKARKTIPLNPSAEDIPGAQSMALDMEREAKRIGSGLHTTKVNGERYYIEFANTDNGRALERMMQNLTPQQAKGIMRMVYKAHNFFKGMFTFKNPLWLTTVAPPMDITAAVLAAVHHQNLKGSPAFGKKLAGKVVANVANPQTWNTARQWARGKSFSNDAMGQELQEMLMAGGAPVHERFMGSVEERAATVVQSLRALQGVDTLSPKERVARLGSALNHWVDGLADITDIAPRLAMYRAAKSEGLSPSDAARLALDSTLNLTRRGEATRAVDLIVPFIGSGVEATGKVLRMASSKRGMAKIAGALITYGVLESMWNSWTSGDSDKDGDPDYLDLDRSGQRASHLTIAYGSNQDDYVKLKVDPLMGYLKFVGNQIGDVMMNSSSPADASVRMLDAGKETITALVGLLSPMRLPTGDTVQTKQLLPSVITSLMPLVGKPFVENAFNQNYFGSPIYKQAYPGSGPRSGMGRPNTAGMWKEFARTANRLTGGTEATSGAVDFQPEQFQHIIESWFGGPVQIAKQLGSVDISKGAAGIPVAKSFVGSGSEYIPQSKYYQNTDKVRQIVERIRMLSPEQVREEVIANPLATNANVLQAFQMTESALESLNKQEKYAYAAAKTPAQKDKVLTEYRDAKNEYYKAFNYVYTSVQKRK